MIRVSQISKIVGFDFHNLSRVVSTPKTTRGKNQDFWDWFKHFSQNGRINLISRPDCYICNDSVDTHIDATFFPSSVIADIWHNLQISAMTDDRHKSQQYGCIQKRLCKCSNVVKKLNWLDHYVRNESQYAPLAYFTLYIFEISFIKWKRAGTHQKVVLGF